MNIKEIRKDNLMKQFLGRKERNQKPEGFGFCGRDWRIIILLRAT